MSHNALQIVDELKHILVEDLFIDLGKDQLKEDDLLSTGIGLDSVGLIELVTIVEDKYGVKLRRAEPDEKTRAAGAAMTLGQFAQHIAERLAAVS